MTTILQRTLTRPATCIASARISTTKQLIGESLKEQARALETFAAGRGWSLLPDGVAQQEIATATKRRRSYEDHLAYIRQHPGEVGYYLIRYIDRFTRQGAAEYERQKRELAELGVALIDTSGIIQEPRNMPELEELGFAYDWSVESPSDLTEVMLSTTAKHERNTILKRIIPRQIAYTQKGFQIGRPEDGYVNQRIRVGAQKRYIQAPDPERAHFIRAVFELRAAAKLSDQEIIRHLNEDLGYRTPMFNRWNPAKTEIIGKSGGNPLDAKQFQRLLQRTAYAGVICKRWTHYKPVRAQWDGLVSIELWNQANRGKRYLNERPDGSIELLYDFSPVKPVHQRLRNNPDYPFKCIRCPRCLKPLKGSAPKGKTKYYPRYHCERGHSSFSVSTETMTETVKTFLGSLEFDEAYFAILREVLILKLEERQKQAVVEQDMREARVAALQEKQKTILEAFLDAKSETTRALLEKQVEDVAAEITRLEGDARSVEFSIADIDKVVAYAREIGKDPASTLIDPENPVRQARLLDLLFEEMPTYDEIDSGTPKIRPFLNVSLVKSTLKKGAKGQCVNSLGVGWNSWDTQIFRWLRLATELYPCQYGGSCIDTKTDRALSGMLDV